jgi:hypothetical protein
LNQLLAEMGLELIDYLRERVRGSRSAIDREERQIRAFFEFVSERPEFYRILHEAEMYAPDGYRRHFENIESRYVRSLRRDWERGEVPGLDERELEVASYVMIAAREYLMIRYCREGNSVRVPPDWVIDAYMKVVVHGIFGTVSEEEGRQR